MIQHNILMSHGGSVSSESFIELQGQLQGEVGTEVIHVVDWCGGFNGNAWKALIQAHQRGEALVVLGAAPFFPGGDTRHLHALSWIDTWELCPAYKDHQLEEVAEGWDFACSNIPPLERVSSGIWRLAHKPDPRGLLFDSQTEHAATIEYPLRWHDGDGSVTVAPVTLLRPFQEGLILWLHFDPTPGWYNTKEGQSFLAGSIRKVLRRSTFIRAWPTKGRVSPDETISLRYELKGTAQNMYRGTLASYPGAILRFLAQHGVETVELTRKAEDEGTLEFVLPNPGLWKISVTLQVSTTNECMGVEEHYSTGVVVIDEKKLLATLGSLPRLSRTDSPSCDMMGHVGSAFPLHGVNYHVSDNYRGCFVRYNAYQNNKDLQVLKKAGFNVIRTGNWQSYDEFFNNDGTLNESALANLEAFFFLAGEAGMQVQFVLGAFIFNPWNRNECPIHNPVARQKVMEAFRSFAQHFSKWPHVQIDALNEPSYSVNGAWHLAKPSEDSFELANWRTWLKTRYQGDISALALSWARSESEVLSFDSLNLPLDHRGFQRGYDRHDVHVESCLHDWYDFARDSFNHWLEEIYTTVKTVAPSVVFMMGRDESLRVPSQQDAANAGVLDMVNFHQWHRDAAIFTEYAFNHVRGLPICGQEMGTYPYGDRRNDPRIDEELRAAILEKKLAYSFGNWIQWQAYNDPYMLDRQERALGLIRADGTPTPSLRIARELASFEEQHKHLLVDYDENLTKVLVVFPTQSYFSVDSTMVFRSMVNCVRLWAERMRLGFHVVLEHLLGNTDQCGSPSLVVVPSVLTLDPETWNLLENLATHGAHILISGSFDLTKDGLRHQQFPEVIDATCRRPCAGVETLNIGSTSYDVSFRSSFDGFEVATIYDAYPSEVGGACTLRSVPWQNGTLHIAPLPLEAADSMDAAQAVYSYVLDQVPGLTRLFELIRDPGPRLGVFARPYKDATLYTMVNEGDVCFCTVLDKRSGRCFTTSLAPGRAAKVWISTTGVILGSYGAQL